MHDYIALQLAKRKNPIEVIVSGLGFMGFGFLSSVQKNPGLRVPLVLTRRPSESLQFLTHKGIRATIEHNPSVIKDNAKKGIVSVSDDTDLIETYENEAVLEVTGTVTYGTTIALKTLAAQKHLITMNPELQVTVGSELKRIADRRGVVITDVIGDQPGSLARMITHARFMGFRVLMAGNMKRYLDRYATQARMKPWADDKGLAVRQTVSFTDGTKQSIEMALVANNFDMDILKPGMIGATVSSVNEALDIFPWTSIPKEGVVDYVLGKELFPGIFVVVEHTDPNQKQYLRYLGLGEGPRYVLFEPYHLCHLEVAGTIARVVLENHPIINNSISPHMQVAAYAKRDLHVGEVIDGIGADMVYGSIVHMRDVIGHLPIGLAEGSVVVQTIQKDQPIALNQVTVPVNAATELAGICESRKPKQYQTTQPSHASL